MRKYVPLLLIIVIAAVLRLYQLGTVPGSMNADEVAIGYNAYSILKTGKDEYGAKFPLSFRSFDDYKAPLYIYLTVPVISLFGLNDFSVRLTSAVAGIITVAFTYFLTLELFNYALRISNSNSKKENKSYEIQSAMHNLQSQNPNTIALIASLLLAISPWHLQFSRSAYEANPSIMFITIGAFAFFMGLRKKNHLLTLAAASFGLSMWVYHTPRIFVPLLVIALAFIYAKELISIWKVSIISLAVGILIAIPMVKILLSSEGAVRARGVSSLSEISIINRSIRWMEDDAKTGASKLQFFHNRRIEFAKTIAAGYLSHFDPAFLFLERAESKYRAPGMGLLYIFELPFLIIGVYKLMRLRTKESILILIWIALAPIAASPTMRLPHPVRTIVFLPVLQIVSGLGAVSLWKFLMNYIETIENPSFRSIKKIVVSCLMFLVPLISVGYYLHQYYVHLNIDNAPDWQYGHKEVVEEVLKRVQQYDNIVVSISLDQPQTFFLYYLKYDPQTYLREGGTIAGKFDTDTNHFSKYEFTTLTKGYAAYGKKALYVGTPTEASGHAITETIYYPNGTPAYQLFTL